MSMNREDTRQLARAFDRREEMQRAREYADKNFWIGVLDAAFTGTGTRSSVMEAAGGKGELAIVLRVAVDQHIESRMKAVDDEIVKLGGTP